MCLEFTTACMRQADARVKVARKNTVDCFVQPTRMDGNVKKLAD